MDVEHWSPKNLPPAKVAKPKPKREPPAKKEVKEENDGN